MVVSASPASPVKLAGEKWGWNCSCRFLGDCAFFARYRCLEGHRCTGSCWSCHQQLPLHCPVPRKNKSPEGAVRGSEE